MRGTSRTAAEMLEYLGNELTGSEMQGKATSQETAGGFTMYQIAEPNSVYQIAEPSSAGNAKRLPASNG